MTACAAVMLGRAVVDRRLLLGARGQGVIEYGLILALTSLFTIIILGVFGGTVADVLGIIGNAIDAATGG